MIGRLRKGEHGQALVEMALVLPLFFLLLFGVIEMGRIGYAYITVSNAAREGGRIATFGASDSDIIISIQSAASSLDPAGLKNLEITPVVRQSGQDVTVKVTYTVKLIIPLITNVISNSVDVHSSITMRME